MQITITGLEAVQAALERLPRGAKSAIKQTIRRSLNDAKRDAKEKVRARYTSPISIFTKSLSTKISGLSGELKSKGSRTPLDEFKTAPGGRIRKRGQYIRAEVVRGQGGVMRKAFRKYGNKSIYERIGRERMPIRKLSSVAPPSMLKVSPVSGPVMQQLEMRVNRELIEALNALI